MAAPTACVSPDPGRGDRRWCLLRGACPPSDASWTTTLPPHGRLRPAIQEFSLDANLGDGGTKLSLATTADARIEDGGRRVTMRRSGYRPQGDFLLEMTARTTEPLRAIRVDSRPARPPTRWSATRPTLNGRRSSRCQGTWSLVVDTSAGGDDADRQLRTDVTEATLRALSTSDRFAATVRPDAEGD